MVGAKVITCPEMQKYDKVACSKDKIFCHCVWDCGEWNRDQYLYTEKLKSLYEFTGDNWRQAITPDLSETSRFIRTLCQGVALQKISPQSLLHKRSLLKCIRNCCISAMYWWECNDWQVFRVRQNLNRRDGRVRRSGSVSLGFMSSRQLWPRAILSTNWLRPPSSCRRCGQSVLAGRKRRNPENVEGVELWQRSRKRSCRPRSRSIKTEEKQNQK